MTGFICHDDYLKKTDKLSDEQFGRLIRACIKYHSTGEIVELNDIEAMAFEFIKFDIDTAEKKYLMKCETNRKNRLNKLTDDNDRHQTSTNDNERERPTIRQYNTIKDNKKKNTNNPLFDDFWKAYPRHVNKQAAMKAFEKVNPDEDLLKTIIDAIEKQKKSEQWSKDNGQFIPHPATWLNGKRWEDEIQPKVSGYITIVPAQDFEQRDYSDVSEQMLDELSKEMNEFKAQGGTK